MKVIVDTSIWSVALRKNDNIESDIITELKELINELRIIMIGPIRQELLSGIKSEDQFKKLKSYLRTFSDYIIHSEDYELAAQYFNQCRREGIQGSNTDFLICSIAVNNSWQIFTTDQDFQNFKNIIPIQLYSSK